MRHGRQEPWVLIAVESQTRCVRVHTFGRDKAHNQQAAHADAESTCDDRLRAKTVHKLRSQGALSSTRWVQD